MNIPVLDRGYIRFVEDWGLGDAGVPEAGIIEAARMSTHKAFQGWESDQKLLAFLYTHKHSSPFEFAGMTIEVEAPIMVFREWHRHRTQAYGEMSARYIPLPNYNYKPSAHDIVARSGANANKQASSTKVANLDQVVAWIERLQYAYDVAEDVYQEGLDLGVPKEIARLPVPVGRYSRMRATGNLRNWLAFLTLRLDPNAQKEIRMYAQALGTIMAASFPRTWELFELERGQHAAM